jgi:hypothetical protein
MAKGRMRPDHISQSAGDEKEEEEEECVEYLTGRDQ